MKTINYIPKITAAKTEYREIDPNDMAWIQSELIRYLSLMAERDLCPSSDSDNQWILDQFWHKRNAKLHKGKWDKEYRQNTPCSFVGGLVNNIVFGTQRDFSAKQMEDLEYVSILMNSLYPALEQIRFQIRIV